ncbi:hypothetical protein Tsubulata_027502 [Turnera subulata]|uniref:PHD-type domain-containing protein n=1 Tax=Turnera subulata TaxID=218843 RepID=A0A9Q0JRU9_9ROSI|nr:hypothetical protein Tsubulata_027502 [Turnera subulata]
MPSCWWRWSRKRFLWLVLFVMTGGRCHRLKKMMGRGPDGGCGAEERPSRPIARVPPSKSLQVPRTAKEEQPSYPLVDVFSQAHKALCERSPFDVPQDGSAPGPSGNLSVCTLPSALASLLKQSDSRKRHKKSHSGSGKKSSRASERSKGGSIWVETEDYFRELESADIDALAELSSSLRSSLTSKCLLIPYVQNEQPVKNEEAVVMENAADDVGRSQIHLNGNINGIGNGNGNGTEDENENENMALEKEEAKEEGEQFMQIDTLEKQSNGVKPFQQQKESVSPVSDSSTRIEWLLGCRNRISLTSERPSKKRKVLGSDAGLEKIFVGSPCAGNTSLCDLCCKGEMGSVSSRLIVCSSCKVAVHRYCYGVQGDVDESWLCCWCKQKIDGNNLPKQPCVLCPKQGGALKPVALEDSGSAVEFAHLFCSQWSPEVYVEDLVRMEPIMNVRGIREARRKSVCNVCKVKCGACVRCSHGSCRTAFHPMCAREAKHKMEVWGKYGYDNVELRAFCSKHSEMSDDRTAFQLGEPSIGTGIDSPDPTCVPVVLSMDKRQKLNCSNEDQASVHVEIPDNSCDKSDDGESREMRLSDSRFDSTLLTKCGDVDELTNLELSEINDIADANPSDSINLAIILKKLIDRGKVSVKDVASEIGISADSLVSSLAEDSLVSDLQCKIVKWLRNNTCLGILQKNKKVRLKSTILSGGETRIPDNPDGITVPESDIGNPVAVKSVPPRRRTKSNIRMLRDNKGISTPEEFLNQNGIVIDDVKGDQPLGEETGNSSQISMSDATEKNQDEFHDSLASCLAESEGNSQNHADGCISERVESASTSVPKQSDSCNAGIGNSVYSDVSSVFADLKKLKAFSGYYLHASIHQKLEQMQSGMFLENGTDGFRGFSEGDSSSLEASSNTSPCCNHQNKQSKCNEIMCKSNGVNSGPLLKAKNAGVFELSPADELEGEIIYFQHRLLRNAAARKHFTDNLISNVARHLPQEIDVARGQRWDAVLSNQYLSGLREAKKQGRKERRHKEAQAVLAAATAAAANSSRISSLRKDGFDESAQQERYGISNGRMGISSQMMSRPKETLQRVAVPRSSSEKYSDFSMSVSDFSKEHPRACDICRRSSIMLNSILVCSSCKVAVHLDCYRSVTGSTGPWYCELCEELSSSKGSGILAVNSWEKPLAECSLCGGSTGAFRKSADGQWVHAFCAEWIFEHTFRRGQVNPVEGMGTVGKGIDICCICRRKHGVCIKCSYGHCQTTFHPSCARSVGFYMNVKTLSGKLQHKAYCEKHGLEQKAKAEMQKHGVEELKSIKQVRVELERLRLLCERIVRREKIKRDLVLCSHNILGYKRDQVARSVLVRSPFFQPDVSSESATTSLKGNTCSDAVQRSDDVTVDSTVSVKQRVKVSMLMDPDQKTDDSSTSQNLLPRKPSERVTFGGKQIPQRASLVSRNAFSEGEWSSKSSKHFDTVESEMVMTSDQASMKNQQLPKGYLYIPRDCLPKEKQMNEDVSSGKLLERDG